MTKETSAHQNVDDKEIEKFQSLANRWWDAEGDMKSLHDINPLRANYIDKLANVSEKTVLDVGCGAGILSEGLAQRGGIVTGIDMGDELINVAKLHLHESKLDIEYQVTSTEALAEKAPETFDVVCCMEMLEHVPDPAAVVKACANLTAPGGHLFFSTINRNPKAWLFAIVGGEYILKLLPKGTHQYEKLIKPSELASYVRQAGCQVDEMCGLEYNPLTKNYFLSKNTSVNYMMHVTKPA
ncbi:MAG: bifunctional 2-polyprenyl-6-hydroxyphenol methylase/3-demethylubiquinol 3-O-methyltransferase UbiG [Cellvibrionales bacterium]|nr:bifunctional 2-polyprenyl-6-hydroxyphenol methylase/3-demethylubiquinol 3-O-methyltransferase UbiG [Cellvibrionales bacterium]